MSVINYWSIFLWTTLRSNLTKSPASIQRMVSSFVLCPIQRLEVYNYGISDRTLSLFYRFWFTKTETDSYTYRPTDGNTIIVHLQLFRYIIFNCETVLWEWFSSLIDRENTVARPVVIRWHHGKYILPLWYTWLRMPHKTRKYLDNKMHEETIFLAEMLKKFHVIAFNSRNG